METLKYFIEDKIIAEILGRQNFTSKENAMLEIIKNSYDAGATYCSIEFSKDSICFSDNGEGMNSEEIKNNWMHIGVSSRGYKNGAGDRVYAGAKGVGRFALARLGDDVEVISKKESCPGIQWKTDWVTSSLNYIKKDQCGTTIQISKLRDDWDNSQVIDFTKYLSVVYRNSKMIIEIFDLKGNSHKVKYLFDNPIIGENFYSSIKFFYNSDTHKIEINIQCDEFSNEVIRSFSDLNFNTHNVNIDMDSEKKSKDWNEIVKKHGNIIEDVLSSIGSFFGEIFFYVSHIPKNTAEGGIYKYQSLPNHFGSGIVLYRNDFATAGCDGSKDWLSLNARSRRSPAAASHKTGQWKVRENQVSGYVVIDKAQNEKLRELSNRQGFENDIYYNIFILIIDRVISEFERYRQELIRKIINIDSTDKADLTVLKKIASGKKKLDNLTDNDKTLLKTEISNAVLLINEFQNNENVYRYDAQILNTLSTIGLIAASIAHELQDDREVIDTNVDLIIQKLQEIGYWDILNSEEFTEYKSSNIPYLLSEIHDVDIKLLKFLDTFLSNIEKSKFIKKVDDIEPVIKSIKEKWMFDYNNLNIEYSLISKNKYHTTEDRLNTIFDNLILNSIQQNYDSNSINIKISFLENEDELEIDYSDDGVGLSEKYKDNPNRILEVNETTLPNGHGLGMWIVNNTVVATNGSIDYIKKPGKGFQIKFHLGGSK